MPEFTSTKSSVLSPGFGGSKGKRLSIFLMRAMCSRSTSCGVRSFGEFAVETLNTSESLLTSLKLSSSFASGAASVSGISSDARLRVALLRRDTLDSASLISPTRCEGASLSEATAASVAAHAGSAASPGGAAAEDGARSPRICAAPLLGVAGSLAGGKARETEPDASEACSAAARCEAVARETEPATRGGRSRPLRRLRTTAEPERFCF